MQKQSVPEDMVTLGKIIGVFGVQGWVKVYSHTGRQDDILRYKPWYLFKDNAWTAVKLLSGKRQGKGLVASIEGITDRDTALALNNVEIAVPRECLPRLSKDEYYWSDLMGLQVITTADYDLGKISHLFETGANDVMVVNGDRERLLPWLIDSVVKSVDLRAGIVVVDWDPDF